jgi:hypothetical protein
MSPEERKAFEEQGAAEAARVEQEFREQFLASGEDLHTLPVANMPTQDFSPPTLEQEVANSVAVVRGVVVSQGQSGGSITSTVRVTASTDATILGSTIDIIQVGGPGISNTGPVLWQRLEDPILWMGREYILFLQPGDGDAYELGHTTAQLRVVNGLIRTESEVAWLPSIAGRSADEVWGQITSTKAALSP